MKRITYSLALAAIIAMVGLFTTAQAQQPYRANHEQVKNLIERIEIGVDAFRASLKNALDKGPLDETRAEDNINQFVQDFEVATDHLKDRYADTYSAVASQ